MRTKLNVWGMIISSIVFIAGIIFMILSITSTADPTYDVVETITTPIDTRVMFSSDNYTDLTLGTTNSGIWANIPGTLGYTYTTEVQARPFEQVEVSAGGFRLYATDDWVTSTFDASWTLADPVYDWIEVDGKQR
jgi:hypothetical protein